MVVATRTAYSSFHWMSHFYRTAAAEPVTFPIAAFTQLAGININVHVELKGWGRHPVTVEKESTW